MSRAKHDFVLSYERIIGHSSREIISICRKCGATNLTTFTWDINMGLWVADKLLAMFEK